MTIVASVADIWSSPFSRVVMNPKHISLQDSKHLSFNTNSGWIFLDYTSHQHSTILRNWPIVGIEIDIFHRHSYNNNNNNKAHHHQSGTIPMSSLQVAYALIRRVVCGAPRLRLASAAGPLVNNYELDCLPLSSTPRRWQPSTRTRTPLPTTTMTTTRTTATLPHNTTWQGQVIMSHLAGNHSHPYTTTLQAHDVLLTTSSPGRVVGKEETVDEQIECSIEEETYRLDPVRIDYETVMNLQSSPPVPIWADSVHHRPGL